MRTAWFLCPLPADRERPACGRNRRQTCCPQSAWPCSLVVLLAAVIAQLNQHGVIEHAVGIIAPLSRAPASRRAGHGKVHVVQLLTKNLAELRAQLVVEILTVAILDADQARHFKLNRNRVPKALVAHPTDRPAQLLKYLGD